MDTFPWVKILEQAGPLIGVIVFFIWRDWQREIRLSRRVEKLEAYQKEILKTLVDRATAVITQSSECIKWIGEVVERLARVCPRMTGKHCDKSEMFE